MSTNPISKSRVSFTYHNDNRRAACGAVVRRDATLVDEEELHLFARATVGLGIENGYQPPQDQSFSRQRCRRDSVLGSSPDQNRLRPADSLRAKRCVRTSMDTEMMPPPLRVRTSTIKALKHPAQMPGSLGPQYFGAEQQQPSSTDDSIVFHALDLTTFDSESDYEDDDGSDCQLREYYSISQAKTPAYDRARAKNRAQSLQRQWRRSGSRLDL